MPKKAAAPKPKHTTYPNAALRALALYAQRLHTPNGAEHPPHLENIYDLVEILGYIQIDTLHMVNRAHYLTLWSRLGSYDLATFDRLIYDPDHRRLYEYWGHAACIMPLSHYRYQAWKMERYRSSPGTWFSRWLEDEKNRNLVDLVYATIRDQGAMRSADFAYDGPKRGSWWDWKPAKLALELLFERGDIMATARINFQRVYDIKERVLPEWALRQKPAPAAEAHRFHVELGARALGVCEIIQIADYAYLKKTTAKAAFASLLKDGTLVEIQGETVDGSARPMVIHSYHLPKLEQAADGALKAERTTFLNPFDSLFWAYDREESLFGFKFDLEMYKRAPDRIWGYYSLAILHKDRLVGRFDPKLDRKTKVLHLRSLHLEPGVTPDDALIADVAVAMRDFMAWHGATELQIEKSNPKEFGKKLLKAL